MFWTWVIFITAVFFLASILLKPLHQVDECYHRMYTIEALHPSASKCECVARQFFLLLQAMGWALLASVTTLPAVAIQGLGLILTADPCHHYFKKHPTPHPVPAENKVSLLSWNICAESGGTPIHKAGVAPIGDRLTGIVSHLALANADVNALHGVFDFLAARRLRKKLEKRGYSYFYHLPDSGVFVASRFKVIDPEFCRFEDKDKQSVFAFTLESQGMALARIHAIQLKKSKRAGRPKQREQDTRAMQLCHLDHMIKNKALPRIPIVIAGEFNMGSKEFRRLRFSDQYSKGNCTLFEKTAPAKGKNLHHIVGDNTCVHTHIPFDIDFQNGTYKQQALSNSRPLYATFSISSA